MQVVKVNAPMHVKQVDNGVNMLTPKECRYENSFRSLLPFISTQLNWVGSGGASECATTRVVHFFWNPVDVELIETVVHPIA